jgi:hypothetical protein
VDRVFHGFCPFVPVQTLKAKLPIIWEEQWSVNGVANFGIDLTWNMNLGIDLNIVSPWATFSV